MQCFKLGIVLAHVSAHWAACFSPASPRYTCVAAGVWQGEPRTTPITLLKARSYRNDTGETHSTLSTGGSAIKRSWPRRTSMGMAFLRTFGWFGKSSALILGTTGIDATEFIAGSSEALWFFGTTV